MVLFWAVCPSCGGVSLSSSRQPVVGVFGQDIILPCQLSPPVRLRDMELLWRKYEPEYIIIHSYTDRGKQEVQGRDYKDRTELFPDEFIRGNLSLKLKSLRVREAGNYQCIVKSAEGNHEALTELQIEATAPVRISVTGPEGSGLGLSCKSTGWFPEPTVRWVTQDGQALAMEPVTTITQDQQQLYTVESHITVPGGKDAGEIRCIVQNSLRGTKQHSAIELGAKGKAAGRKVEQEVTLLDKDVLPKTMEAENTDLRKWKAFRKARSYQVAITLDPSHQHPELIVSEQGQCVQCRPSSLGPAPCIAVGHQGFASQRAYWEVEVGDGEDWELGVLSESTRAQVRRGEVEERPKEGFWALGRAGGQYHPLEADTLLQSQEKAVVIGVYLDGEAGKLMFYNVVHMALIMEIPVPDSETLYPFLSPGPAMGGAAGDPLRICPPRDWDFPQQLVPKRSPKDAQSKDNTKHRDHAAQEGRGNDFGPSSASPTPVTSCSSDCKLQESQQLHPGPSQRPGELQGPPNGDKEGLQQKPLRRKAPHTPPGAQSQRAKPRHGLSSIAPGVKTGRPPPQSQARLLVRPGVFGTRDIPPHMGR
ncbi:butyrophilin subfamily 3 member A1-like [Apteryx mantelli]|uniref:Butyrophilin subfamily 3 member A1-like n=1 Tax=Apteryx mantelli TaxID=2696672 RepID=A0ABM4FZK3_9AVES